MPGVGRGRGAITPAWMTNPDLAPSLDNAATRAPAVDSRFNSRPVGNERQRERSRSRERNISAWTLADDWSAARSSNFSNRDNRNSRIVDLFTPKFYLDDQSKARRLDREGTIDRLYYRGPDVVDLVHRFTVRSRNLSAVVDVEKHRYTKDAPGRFDYYLVGYSCSEGRLDEGFVMTDLELHNISREEVDRAGDDAIRMLEDRSKHFSFAMKWLDSFGFDRRAIKYSM